MWRRPKRWLLISGKDAVHTPSWPSMASASNTKFLGVHIADTLNWSINTTALTKKAQQRLHFLQRWRKVNTPTTTTTHYHNILQETIESTLTQYITAWYGNCTTADCKLICRLVRAVEKITGVSLCAISDIYTDRCVRKATKIISDPSLHLFALLLSGSRLQSKVRKSE